jgi:hypothetical protein
VCRCSSCCWCSICCSHQSQLCYAELGGGRTVFFFHAPLLSLQLSLFKKWLEVCMGGFLIVVQHFNILHRTWKHYIHLPYGNISGLASFSGT